MKRALAILLVVGLVVSAWMAMPVASTKAQINTYGPNVISELKRFDEVFKTADTHDLISGKSDTRFRIISLFVRSNSSTANDIYFSEEGVTDTVFGTNSTDKETLHETGVDGKAGWLVSDSSGGWYETSTDGTAFQITLSTAQKVAVVGTYVEVDWHSTIGGQSVGSSPPSKLG